LLANKKTIHRYIAENTCYVKTFCFDPDMNGIAQIGLNHIQTKQASHCDFLSQLYLLCGKILWECNGSPVPARLLMILSTSSKFCLMVTLTDILPTRPRFGIDPCVKIWW